MLVLSAVRRCFRDSLVPACGIRLVIMTGRKKHLFLHRGGLLSLADKAITRSSSQKLDKFNLEIRHGFLAARKIKVLRGNAGVAVAWSTDKICYLSEKGFLTRCFGRVVCCVCRRSVERSRAVGELLDVIKWPFWFGSVNFYNKSVGHNLKRAVRWSNILGRIEVNTCLAVFLTASS